MYSSILAIHSILRWVVLILLIIAIVKGLMGWFGRKEFGASEKKLSLFNMIAMDLNTTIGLLLYFVFSPMTKMAFSDFGAAMKDPNLRFWAVEHILVMLMALVLIHVARNVTKKDIPDTSKYRKTLVFYSLALVLILSRIPWDVARLDFAW